MSIFDSALADDARFSFLADDGFGSETVTYTNAAGTTRTIKAQVERYPAVPYDGGHNQPYIIVQVMNSTTYGIASSEVNYGGDTITLQSRDGVSASSKAFRIHRPADGQPDHDAGMLRVELR